MKMQHVTIQSPCFEESVKFYQEIVGLTIVRELKKDPAPYDITFLANAAGETCIEIIDSPESEVTSGGISIGFAVDNVEGYREQLLQQGRQCSPVIFPNPVTKFFFTKDPNGIDIQFINE